MDEFDFVLLEGVQNGFFDSVRIEKYGSELNKKITAAQSDSSFEEAWRLYHESFADDEEQVLDAIYHSFLDTVQYRSLLDLNGTVWLLKSLGRAVQASECINRYLASRGNDRKSLDLDNHPFRNRIDDLDVVKALKDECATLTDARDPMATLLSIANTHGWSDEDITMLSTLSSDQYYKIFKENRGGDLLKAVDACLQFDRIQNATSPMKEISSRAKEALRRIGQESPVNALRVRKYGTHHINTSRGWTDAKLS